MGLTRRGGVSLPNSGFDKTFHFSFLMLFNSPRHREPLPSQDREGKTLLVVKSIMASRTTRVGWGRGGGEGRGGLQVFTTSSQSSIDAMWCQLKVTKTWTLPHVAPALQKPRALTLGVKLASQCQKMCQVSTCFIRCTFFIPLGETCPQQPQTLFIRGGGREIKRPLLLCFPPLILLIVQSFSGFERGPRFVLSSGPGSTFCFCLAPICSFLVAHKKPPVCFVISSSHPHPIPTFVQLPSKKTRSYPSLFLATLWGLLVIWMKNKIREQSLQPARESLKSSLSPAECCQLSLVPEKLAMEIQVVEDSGSCCWRRIKDVTRFLR